LTDTAPRWALFLSTGSIEQLFRHCPLAAILWQKTEVIKFKKF